jgi:hypothetical protein
VSHTAKHWADQVRQQAPDAVISPSTKAGQLALRVLGRPEFGRYELDNPLAVTKTGTSDPEATIQSAKAKANELGLDGTAFVTTIIASSTVGLLLLLVRHVAGGDR